MSTIAVGGVQPPGYTPTITGEAICGQAITGGVYASVFGTVTVLQTVHVAGVPSAGMFGGAAPSQRVSVPGVPPSTVVNDTITGLAVCGLAICGWNGQTQFGTPYVFDRLQFIGVSGVGSAQAFGAVTIIPGPVSIPVGGVPSAGLIGAPRVYLVWERIPPPCLDLDLVESNCTSIDLAESQETDLVLSPLVCT